MSDESQIYQPDNPEGFDQVEPSLPNVGILSSLTPNSLENLTKFGVYSSHDVGEAVIVEGRMQDRIYMVVRGRLRITAMIDGSETSLADAEEGECIGELSVYEPAPATATVTVTEKCLLWSMDLPALHRYLADHVTGGIALLMGVAQCLSQRIRLVNHKISQHSLSFAPMPRLHSTQALKYDAARDKGGFFNLLKSKMASEKKVVLPTEIKI
jgi:CRP-like cAMP-binding protein